MNSLADNTIMLKVKAGDLDKMGLLFERYHRQTSKDLVQRLTVLGFLHPINEINNWAYSLSGKGIRPRNFQIKCELISNNYNVYDSLAELYESVGNKESAIKNFKRLLELNPKNANAVDHLKHLE